MNINKRLLLLLIPAIVTVATSACGQQKPTADQATPVLLAWYKANSPRSGDLKVQIIKIGEMGKGDFAAPGSQDSYWPVEFTINEVVNKIGPVEMTATKAHAAAYLWQDKLGRWKIANIEALPVDVSPPPSR